MTRDSSTDAPQSGPRPGAPGTECRIETFELGPFATNCYLVYESGGPQGRPCWIIDASFEPEALIARVQKLGLVPDALILTHAHVDHIAGVDDVLEAFPGLKVFGHAAEKDWPGNPVLNLGAPVGMDVRVHGMDGFLREGLELSLGSQKWRVLETPGHSPGGITLYNPQARAAIVGDSLFAGSIGRTDFPGSDFETLAQSIRTRLYTLPDDTRIYPGHGPSSTIGHEKRTNPFVQG